MTRRDVLRGASLAVAGAGLIDLAAWGEAPSEASSSAASAATPKRGGTVQVAAGDASVSENLEPQRPWNQNNGIYAQLAYESLVEADDAFRLTPKLATSWSSDATAKVWTFKVRKGVSFHDGTALTAHDVVWSMQRLLKPALASPLYGPLHSVLEAANVKAVDDYTVVAKLTHPDVYFPILWAKEGTEIVKNGQNTFPLAKAVGTGPFKFTSFQAGQGYSAVRNEKYWQKGLPYLDGVRGVSIPDATALVQAVTSGQSHVTTSISFAEMPIVKASGNATVLSVPAFFDNYIIMNARHHPFGDVRVRQAVKLADNRQRILKAAYQGNGVLTSDTPAPSNDPLYPASLGIRRQNISRAKQLLAAAGYPKGIDLTLFTSELLGGMVDEAVTFSQAVAPAGIRIKIKQHPAATYWEEVWLKEAFYTSWTPRTHPSVRVPQSYASFSGWPETQIPHTKVDSLLAAALAATDPVAQKKTMGTLLTWIADNDGYISATFQNLAIATKKNLQGVAFPQGKGGPALGGAWLA